MKKTLMRKYAKLAVKTGVNIQKGQGCIINANVSNHEFISMVVEEAYRAGAKWVEVNWSDPAVEKLKYRHETLTQLSKVEEWEKAKMQYQVDNLPVMLHIFSGDPDGMKGVNMPKLQKSSGTRKKILKPYRNQMEDKYQWSGLVVPTRKWAKKVFPNDLPSVAEEKLWNEVLKAVRVSEDNDPQAEWDKHNKALAKRCKQLGDYDFEYLTYKSKNGTDFKCWLIPGSKWTGGGMTTIGGTYFNPNMPTEEVFISPIKGKCEGKLVTTLPMSVNGTLIEKFAFTFKDGKVVKVEADTDKNRETLERLVATDEGAAMVGELALVPMNSPISNSGILFYNGLFDENAACHVALGRGFNMSIPGYEKMSIEEVWAKGVNDSVIHFDFFIGSSELDIVGHTRDGKDVQVFKNGEWAI